MSQPNRPVVSIIIVSYKTREMTLECLRSLVRETKIPYQLIVLDNASDDGSAAAIAAEFPDILLLTETENSGFAKANNIAARHATGEYVLLLNPDTVVLDGAIDKLLAFAEATPEAQIWGGKTLFGDHSLNATSCFRRPTLWSIFCHSTGLSWAFRGNAVFNSECYGSWQRDTVRAVDIVTGCFFLLKRDLWEALDGFNLTYVMFGEETDLCLRAIRDHGANPHVTPDAVIIHYGGASEKVRAERMVRLIRSKLTLIRHHLPAWQRPAARWLSRLSPLFRAGLARGAVRLRPKRFVYSAQTWGAIWDRRREWWHGYPDV